MAKLFPTTLVGSYPQPDWLIDRKKLAGRFPPRVRAKELWRVAPDWLARGQDDATRVALPAPEGARPGLITHRGRRPASDSNPLAPPPPGGVNDKTRSPPDP